MVGRLRVFSPLLFLVAVGAIASSCDVKGGIAPISEDAGSSSSSSSSSGDLGPCGEDCSKRETAPCLIAVCNTGQEQGPLDTCVVVPATKGTACDDGKFCTVSDVCDDGVCGGGSTNHCGIKTVGCESILCYEDLKKCDTTPVGDGEACTPSNLCQLNGICTVGKCVGEPKDCSFSPLIECNAVACEPATGKCIGAPDAAKDNNPCVLTGDICNVKKICQAGQCVGGVSKDCSSLDVGCEVGSCNPSNGLCGRKSAPIGTICTPGLTECQVGACDTKGKCVASSAPDGTSCNDYDACTQMNECMSGVCAAGSTVSGCSAYLHEGFETCPNGWTFGGDWECGMPDNVGPPSAHIGNGAIGTQIAGLYHVNQSYGTTVANSPTINLTGATNPMVSFWAWDHSEGGSFDGWNLKISTNNGQSFAQVATVTPAYDLMIAGQPAWGGDYSSAGWRNFSADLSAYAGQSIILRYAFRSDGATVYPGVYIDEVVVAEPVQIPLYIATSSPLEDIYSGMAYASPVAKIGGSNGVAWSLKPGGQNAAWLSIDPATGILNGTPSSAETGPVTVTVHVEEPSLPSNFAEKTLTFNVKSNAYYTSFEGSCPNGWTLTGDWECGVPMLIPPMMLGPATAYVGTQCLATKLAALYSNLQTYNGTTATSPDIDLTNAPSSLLTFRMWMDTEGSTYDGVNLKVSTDGGQSYTIVNGVSPVYNLTVAGQTAWGGHQSGLNWQLFQADLSPYAGQVVRLRFSFQTDSSGVFPGVYIDDFFIN